MRKARGEDSAVSEVEAAARGGGRPSKCKNRKDRDGRCRKRAGAKVCARVSTEEKCGGGVSAVGRRSPESCKNTKQAVIMARMLSGIAEQPAGERQAKKQAKKGEGSRYGSNAGEDDAAARQDNNGQLWGETAPRISNKQSMLFGQLGLAVRVVVLWCCGAVVVAGIVAREGELRRRGRVEEGAGAGLGWCRFLRPAHWRDQAGISPAKWSAQVPLRHAAIAHCPPARNRSQPATGCGGHTKRRAALTRPTMRTTRQMGSSYCSESMS